MATTLHTNVRKDGCINLKAKGRKMLGLKDGMGISISIEKGVATIKPHNYYCTNCKQERHDPLTSIGVCHSCEDIAIQALRTGTANNFEDALKEANVKLNKAKPGKKV